MNGHWIHLAQLLLAVKQNSLRFHGAHGHLTTTVLYHSSLPGFGFEQMGNVFFFEIGGSLLFSLV